MKCLIVKQVRSKEITYLECSYRGITYISISNQINDLIDQIPMQLAKVTSVQKISLTQLN